MKNTEKKHNYRKDMIWISLIMGIITLILIIVIIKTSSNNSYSFEDESYTQTSLSAELSTKIAESFLVAETDYAENLTFTGMSILEKTSVISYSPISFDEENRESYLAFLDSLSQKIKGIVIIKNEDGYVTSAKNYTDIDKEKEINQIYGEDKSVQLCVVGKKIVGFMISTKIDGATYFDWRMSVLSYSNGLTPITNENANSSFPVRTTPEILCTNMQDILTYDDTFLYILNIAGISISDGYSLCLDNEYSDALMAMILSFMPSDTNDKWFDYQNEDLVINQWHIPAIENPYQFTFDKATSQLIAVYFECHNDKTDKDCIVKVVGNEYFIREVKTDNNESPVEKSWTSIDEEFINNYISTSTQLTEERNK